MEQFANMITVIEEIWTYSDAGYAVASDGANFSAYGKYYAYSAVHCPGDLDPCVSINTACDKFPITQQTGSTSPAVTSALWDRTHSCI